MLKITFNSLYWVQADFDDVTVEEVKNFQFPLLGSSYTSKPTHPILCTTFNSLYWVRYYLGKKGGMLIISLSIPFIGFRIYLFFFLVFKVFGMVNLGVIMA